MSQEELPPVDTSPDSADRRIGADGKITEEQGEYLRTKAIKNIAKSLVDRASELGDGPVIVPSGLKDGTGDIVVEKRNNRLTMTQNLGRKQRGEGYYSSTAYVTTEKNGTIIDSTVNKGMRITRQIHDSLDRGSRGITIRRDEEISPAPAPNTEVRTELDEDGNIKVYSDIIHEHPISPTRDLIDSIQSQRDVLAVAKAAAERLEKREDEPINRAA